MLASQNVYFSSSSSTLEGATIPPTYLPLTPPYCANSWEFVSSSHSGIQPFKQYTSFNDITCSFCAEEHMQQLRFPTPPITPPRLNNNFANGMPFSLPSNISTTINTKSSSAALWPMAAQRIALPHIRTKSVIMKIGRQSPTMEKLTPANTNTNTNTNTISIDDHDNDDEDHNNEADEQESVLRLPATDNGVSSTSGGSGCGSAGSGSESASPHSSCSYVCEWRNCHSCFENLDSLASHVTQFHAVASHPDGLYYCRWNGCQRSERGFNARYKMLVHARTHTKEKPHTCQLCGKSFSRAENLKIHIRSHSGEKPYVCTFEGCHKAYSNSSDRFKHTRTHANEKPYVCKVIGCQKRYTDPSSLRKHVKTFKHTMQLRIESGTTQLPSLPHATMIVDEDCSSGSPAATVYESPLNHYSVPESNAVHSLPTTRDSQHYWYAPHTEAVLPTSHIMEMEMDMSTTLPASAITLCNSGVPESPLDLRLHRR